jgi:hypothetical protein
MKYIKKFELLDWRNVDYANIDEYKNTFVIINDSSDYHLFLVTDISFDRNINNTKIQYLINGYSFKGANKIFNQCTVAFLSRSKEEFSGLIFLTPNEFYEQYPDLCYNLYLKLYNDNENQPKWTSNYKDLIRKVLPILTSIEELKTKIEADEYNL